MRNPLETLKSLELVAYQAHEDVQINEEDVYRLTDPLTLSAVMDQGWLDQDDGYFFFTEKGLRALGHTFGPDGSMN